MATAVQVSVTQISHAFRLARETVSRRLADAKVKPTGKSRGGPAYELRDVVRALLDPDAAKDPFRRKADLQSEEIELRLKVERGELIPRDDVRETWAEALKPVRLALETLPDVLERDVALTPAQVACAERVIDEVRTQLHGQVLKVANARSSR